MPSSSSAAARPLDALVIGGGPAGLAGAIYLARFRRDVIVVDANDSRALRIPRSHNVAGFPGGITGSELLDRMRRQVAALGVPIVPWRAGALRREDGFFVADTDGEPIAARNVLLATGARDVEPPMDDAGASVRRGALRYCPVCDGYEAAGLDVAVLCNSTRGVAEARYLRHFSDRVQAFALPGFAFDEARRSELQRDGIRVHADAVTSIESLGPRIAITHGAHTTDCDAMYSALGLRVESSLALQLGAASDDDGYVLSDRHQHTRVPGLFVAGDVARGLNQISVAIGEAAIAASAMHRRLLAPDD